MNDATHSDRPWLGPVATAVREAGSSGAFLIVFPDYRPDLVREMAHAMSYAYFDFRSERMMRLGWRAAELSLAELEDAARNHAAGETAAGLVLHNAEALLATRAVDERRRWLAAVCNWPTPRPILVSTAVFNEDLPPAGPRVVHIEGAALSQQSLLMRLSRK